MLNFEIGHFFFQALRNTLKRANDVYDQFIHSNIGRNFSGEIFVVGDYLGGILLHECLKCSSMNNCQQYLHKIISRHSSNFSTKSQLIANECDEEEVMKIFHFHSISIKFWKINFILENINNVLLNVL